MEVHRSASPKIGIARVSRKLEQCAGLILENKGMGTVYQKRARKFSKRAQL